MFLMPPTKQAVAWHRAKTRSLKMMIPHFFFLKIIFVAEVAQQPHLDLWVFYVGITGSLGNVRIIHFLKNLLRVNNNPHILFISETICNKHSIEAIRISLGFSPCFFVERNILSGGLALIWYFDLLIWIFCLLLWGKSMLRLHLLTLLLYGGLMGFMVAQTQRLEIILGLY